MARYITTDSNQLHGENVTASATAATDFPIFSQLDYGVIRTAVTGAPGNAQNIGALASGILYQTVTAGVSTLSIAIAGTTYANPNAYYFVNQSTPAAGPNQVNLGALTTGVPLITVTTGVAAFSTQTFTTGSVLFAGTTGLLTQDNANLFWNDTNNRLGIGTSAPGTNIEIYGGPSSDQIRLGAGAGLQTRIGRNSVDGYLDFYGDQTTHTGYRLGGIDGTRMLIDSSGDVTVSRLSGGAQAMVYATTAGLLARSALSGLSLTSGTLTNTGVLTVSGTAAQIASSGGQNPVLSLIATAVTAAAYTYGSFTVDAYGRLTAASSGAAPVTSIVAGTNVTISGTTAVTVNAVTGMTTGSVLFSGASSVVTQDNTNWFWDNTNKRLGIGYNVPAVSLDIQNLASTQLRLGYSVYTSSDPQYSYDIGRVTGGGDDGLLRFYGNSASQYGFLFTGLTGGDYLRIAHGGATTVTNLGGGTQAIVYATTAGLLGRVALSGLSIASGTLSNTGVLSVSGTATRISSSGGQNPVIDLITTAVTAASYTNASITVDAYGRLTAASSGTAPVISIVAGTNVTVSGTTTVTVNAVTGMTTGSVLFSGASSVVTQDNSKFFWDNTNKRLGIGTATPGASLEVFGGTSSDGLRMGGGTGVQYKIGRNSTDGRLDFYGDQTSYNGYTFGGVDGTWMTINNAPSTAGVVTIGNLGGGSAAIVSASTAGALGRVTIGSGLSFSGGTLSSTATGTVTSVSAGTGITVTGTTAVTVNSNLSTGVSGGQTAYGGTAASNNLVLTSTTNATTGIVRVLSAETAYTSPVLTVESTSATGQMALHYKSNGTLRAGIRGDYAGALNHFATGTGSQIFYVGGDAGTNSLELTSGNAVKVSSLNAGGMVYAAATTGALGIATITTPISYSSGTLSHATSGVTAGTYQCPTITVNATGHITSAATVNPTTYAMQFGGYFPGIGTQLPCDIGQGQYDNVFSGGASAIAYRAPFSATNIQARFDCRLNTFNAAVTVKVYVATIIAGTIGTLATATTGNAGINITVAVAAGDMIEVQLNGPTTGGCDIRVTLGFYSS